MTEKNQPQTSVAQMLEQQGHRNRHRRLSWTLVLLLFLAIVVAVYTLLVPSASEKQREYITEVIERGDLTVTVSATGNLQPLNQVDIGSELSGTIEAVLVDVNDTVRKGQLLARLNSDQLKHAVTRAQAALASAKAKVRLAEVTEHEARLNLERLQDICNSCEGLLAQSEVDAAEATLQRAEAEHAVALTVVESAEAELNTAQSNLAKAAIHSPIDGVVLVRSVEPGQTVAASFSAPTLFTLAEDLSQMTLEVSVDEADVGQVVKGQSAEFSVDAWPGRQYPALITRVSLGSTITDNVVSYLTVLAVDNLDLSLRPGMTATAAITTATRQDVRLVPNAALRYSPELAENDQATPEQKSSMISKLLPRPPRTPKRVKRNHQQESAEAGRQQTVWVLESGQPVAVGVITGISDGKLTEILGGQLQAGQAVIIGDRA